MYKWIRSLLFIFPPESVHHFSMFILNGISATSPGLFLLRRAFSVHEPSLGKYFAGIFFRNQIGLGAGFDKNAKYLQSLETLGFGFVEIGTVTPIAQEGNDQPRLFRLKKDQALINRMGFNNDGAAVVAGRLSNWKLSQDEEGKPPGSRLIVGGNIGKNKVTPNESAWKDYETCFIALFEVVDYFVVNVSSPNTPGLRALQEKESLRKILVHLQTTNVQLAESKNQLRKPLLL